MEMSPNRYRKQDDIEYCMLEILHTRRGRPRLIMVAVHAVVLDIVFLLIVQDYQQTSFRRIVSLREILYSFPCQ